MTFPRLFLLTFVLLFGAIGVAKLIKKNETVAPPESISIAPIEIQLAPRVVSPPEVEVPVAETHSDVDRVSLLFQRPSPLPIVETIPYKSKVNWKQSRSAWLVDYAAHYKTHLHFIARSLNGKPDYSPKAAREGEMINVLSTTKNFYFHLLVDLSACRMSFYYVCPDENERMLLKTYRVGLGRPDASKASGYLTPVGRYKLGGRVAVFQPKMMGSHKGQKVELIRVFGTRWIPFEKEIGECSEPAKSYGIHGTPWSVQGTALVDNPSSIGRYESDGCIRLGSKDIEELFAIIATRDAVVEIVSNLSVENK